jgi:hypothetical protein
MKVKLLKVIQVNFQEGGLTLNAYCETKWSFFLYTTTPTCPIPPAAGAGASSHFVLHRTESHDSEIFSHITSRWENFSLAY